MSLDDDLELFETLRARLLSKLDAREEELAVEVAKAKDAKRRVSGRGRRGEASAPGEGTQGNRVLVWLLDNPGPHTPGEIASGVGLARTSVNQALVALHGAGLIERPWRGVYRHVDTAVRLLPPHEPVAPPPEQIHGPTRETPADRLRRMEKARAAQPLGRS
jgi:DNA-binding transcriptional ArsR family regulator